MQAKFVALFSAIVALSATVAQAAAIDAVNTQFMDLAKRRDSGYAGPPGAPTTGGASNDDSYGPPPSRNPATFYHHGQKWVYHGCWTDRSGHGQTRALTGWSASSEHRTVEYCLAACSNRNEGYNFAGLEYGKECYCGRVIESFSKPTATCDMVCSSANGQICGGRNALTMYKIEGAPNGNGQGKY